MYHALAQENHISFMLFLVKEEPSFLLALH
jgi:hypothetical protein